MCTIGNKTNYEKLYGIPIMTQIILKEQNQYLYDLEKDTVYQEFLGYSGFSSDNPEFSKESRVADLLNFIASEIDKEAGSKTFNIVRLMTIIERSSGCFKLSTLKNIFLLEATRLLLSRFDEINRARELKKVNSLETYQDALNKDRYTADKSDIKQILGRDEIVALAKDNWQVEFEGDIPAVDKFATKFDYDKFRKCLFYSTMDSGFSVDVFRFDPSKSLNPSLLKNLLEKQKEQCRSDNLKDKIDEVADSYERFYNCFYKGNSTIQNKAYKANLILSSLSSKDRYSTGRLINNLNKFIEDTNKEICMTTLEELCRLMGEALEKKLANVEQDKQEEATVQMDLIGKLALAKHTDKSISPKERAHLTEFLVNLISAIKTPTRDNKINCLKTEEKAIGGYSGFKIMYGAALILFGTLVIATAVVTSIALIAATIGLAAPVSLPAGIGMGVTGVGVVAAGVAFLFFDTKKAPLSENIMSNLLFKIN